MKVLILGGTGQLGNDLGKALRRRRHVVTPWGSDDLDVTNSDQVTIRIAEENPDLVANLAAYANVDGAENDPHAAFRVNALGASHVACAAEEAGAAVLYVSTDYVFDGKKNTPYVESDLPSPLNVYGITKRSGEMMTTIHNQRSFIVRTAWLFGVRGFNFPLHLLRQARDEKNILAVDDQRGSPTWTGHLANYLARLVETEDYGTHHVSGSGSATWYELAKEVLDGASTKNILSRVPEIKPMDSKSLIRPAPRPAYSVLGTERKPLWTMPPWEEGVEEFLVQIAVRGSG